MVTGTKEKYYELLTLLNSEALKNESVSRLLVYLQKYENKFHSIKSKEDVENLMNYIGGASRFAGEFIFTEENKSKIWELFENLYVSINDLLKYY